MSVARRHDPFILSDEIYRDLVFDGAHVRLAELAPERSAVVTGVSKSYAMTGFRVGFVRAPEAIIDIAMKRQEPLVSCGTSISQHGALAAITGPQDCVAEMRDAYRRRRDLAVEFLRTRNNFTYRPRGAFYLMVDVSGSGLDGEAFALELLETRRVGVAPGKTVGPDSGNYIRVSLASSEEEILHGPEAVCGMLENWWKDDFPHRARSSRPVDAPERTAVIRGHGWTLFCRVRSGFGTPSLADVRHGSVAEYRGIRTPVTLKGLLAPGCRVPVSRRNGPSACCDVRCRPEPEHRSLPTMTHSARISACSSAKRYPVGDRSRQPPAVAPLRCPSPMCRPSPDPVGSCCPAAD